MNIRRSPKTSPTAGGLLFVRTLSHRVLRLLLALSGVALFLATHPTRCRPAPPAIAGYVAVRLERSANFLIIRTKINGHVIPLMLDTGAQNTILSQTAYAATTTPEAESHLPPKDQRSGQVNGKSATLGWVEDMRAGEMDLGSVTIRVTELARMHNYPTRVGNGHVNVEGLLGEDVLIRYGAIIDPSREVIYFNTDPAKRARLGPLLVEGGWTAIPMQPTNERHFSVPTEIAGKSLQLIVDTGSPTTTLDRGRVEDLKLDTKETFLPGGILNDKEAQRQRSVLLKGWKIGNYTIPSFPVSTFHLPLALLNDRSASGYMVGLLGADVLLINHAFIDIGDKTLYLHPY